jgi:hypothetical protein
MIRLKFKPANTLQIVNCKLHIANLWMEVDSEGLTARNRKRFHSCNCGIPQC